MVIEWTSELSVHIHKIDKQHQHFFSLVNLLEEAVLSNRGDKVFHHILQEMGEYAKYHFATEERLMELYEYSGLEAQRVAHEAFIVKIMEFNFHPDTTGDRPVEILDFLTRWASDHIVSMDKKFGDFCEQSGLTSSDIGSP